MDYGDTDVGEISPKAKKNLNLFKSSYIEVRTPTLPIVELGRFAKKMPFQ